MFVYSFKASSVKIICALALCAVALVAAIILLPEAGSSLNVNKIEGMEKLESINVKKEKGRIEYLSALGYTVDEQSVTPKSEKLAESLDAVTEKYNELQRFQGFDLTRYCGKTLDSYTYRVCALPDGTNVDSKMCLATLVVHKGRVVAADLCYPETGEIAPLVKPI